MGFKASYLENKHSDPPYFGFWQKLIFTLLHGALVLPYLQEPLRAFL